MCGGHSCKLRQSEFAGGFAECSLSAKDDNKRVTELAMAAQ